MGDELNRSIEELWRDYEFLTKEISRFIDVRDNTMVEDFVQQRQKLEMFIKEKNDQIYHKTPEGKAHIGSILAINQEAAKCLQQRYNTLQNQHKVFLAYDKATPFTGARIETLDEDM